MNFKNLLVGGNTSICRLTPDRWMLGSSKVCERVTAADPSSAIISWQDGDDIFYLRERVEEDILLPQDGLEPGLVHTAGTSAAIWSIGSNAFCKVKSWCEGLESESDTIQFVSRSVPCIPLPEVVYSWVDYEWNRSFLILKRVHGETLQDAWPRLSSPQRSQIAGQIAKYCSKLAAIMSPRFESATGRGVLEPFLTQPAEPSHPSWKPRPLGPLPLADFNTFSSLPHSGDIGPAFYFYHADLGPSNIMVSEEGNVEGILDWESSGFYPEFWIASKPLLSAGFYLNCREGREAWRDLLVSMLMKEGYKPMNVDLLI
jgi:hypothetical protein